MIVEGLFSWNQTIIVFLILCVGLSIHVTRTDAQTLREPVFEEKWKITDKKAIGENKMQMSYASNGTIKGTIEVDNKGESVSISKGNNVTFTEGSGVITTKDGKESTNYTFIGIGDMNEEGKPASRGSVVYSTNSTGELAFLNNTVTMFKGESDQGDNFVSKEWEWK